MNAIVAVDESWNIGYKGQLLCHLKRDLAYFKEHTLGGIIIMGRKTFESLPGKKPLPKRVNIVISRNAEELAHTYSCAETQDSQLQFCSSINDGLALADKISYERNIPAEKVFCIGGGSLYRAMLPFCRAVYVTKIHKTFEADTHFPNLDELSAWQCVQESPREHEGDLTFSFCVYEQVS